MSYTRNSSADLVWNSTTNSYVPYSSNRNYVHQIKTVSLQNDCYANINYLKPGKGPYLTAESEMLKQGNKICFLKANIYDSEHNLIANMEGTYYFVN